MDATMNTETIATTERERERTSYIAEGRIVRARAERGSLRGGWQSSNGTLTCRWNWVALQGEDDADGDTLAA